MSKRLEPTVTVILSNGQEINGIDCSGDNKNVPPWVMPVLEIDHGRAVKEWHIRRDLISAVGYHRADTHEEAARG
jgi:hypothetical protein